MDLSAYRLRDVQNIRSILNDAKSEALSIDQLIEILDVTVSVELGDVSVTKQHRDRLSPGTVCSVCGKSTVIVLVNTNPGNRVGDQFTHAIQCQNRPGAGQKWKNGMCGHTEYIVRGNKQ